ncbi:MAG: DNA primase [Candidatus Neomarinimicrobiota bacterium]
MARIAPDVIDRVRDTADIVEVVQQYVNLTKRGRNYFGLCPFHHEKTASFSVAPDKNIYHCFGCGAGGTAINFLMEYEKISFVEAVQKLGDRYGIKVEAEQGDGSRELFSQLYELHELATEVYHKLLLSTRGQAALKYLQERGLTSELLQEFRIGFAPDAWDTLITEAGKREFSTEVLAKSGLFTFSEKGRFDRFRSRIMFPIANAAGRVIAFGGRIFGAEDPAKYLNSPETPLYHKSDVLYGLHKTREAIRAAGSLILVEGYMDFLTLYQAGITNLAAVSGTALTERHAVQIHKVASKVYLAYDGDQAGITATLRAGYALYRGNVEPLVIPVPADKDPDDWVREAGPAAFRQVQERASSLVDFQLDVKNADQLTGVELSQFVGELLGEVGAIEDGILRGEILRQISQRLRIEETDLLQVLQKRLRRRVPEIDPEPPPDQAPLEFTSRLQKAQVEIVKMLATGQADARQFAQEHLDLKIFTEPLLKKLATELLKTDSASSLAAVVDQFEKKSEREAAARILFAEFSLELTDPVPLVRECLITIRKHPIREKIKQLRLALREREASGQDTLSLEREINGLQQDLQALAGAYD